MSVWRFNLNSDPFRLITVQQISRTVGWRTRSFYSGSITLSLLDWGLYVSLSRSWIDHKHREESRRCTWYSNKRYKAVKYQSWSILIVLEWNKSMKYRIGFLTVSASCTSAVEIWWLMDIIQKAIVFFVQQRIVLSSKWREVFLC